MTELGNQLKEARQAKGLSLDELQNITKIQTRYLKGIEEGNYDMMPGKFYVRAFIKQYAEAVDLDPDVLFEEYKNDIPEPDKEEMPEQISKARANKTISEGASKLLDMFPKILLAVVIIGAIALIWYFLYNYASDRADSPNTGENNTTINYEKPKDSPLADSNKAANDAKDKEKNEAKEEKPEKESETDNTPKQELAVTEKGGSNTVYELKNSDKFVLKIVSTGESWIEVENGNGKSFYSAMLTSNEPEGQTFDFTNENEAYINVGRASEAEIYVNDQKLEYAISPTDIVRQDITIRFTRKSE
ncbi:helix-turn-helix domain-containing protein [Bacillus aquiflavi]|uniref:Helix-turn-helix domain-containing protein n=1 Tax=Bacillus aquiflavi TaxID=2672567 RepID=A0A6B3VTU9_9BACI|nr:RodZ domain-containing protein [Bacillus aquiflavi]MBA4536260.1 helix-turn-helix domain-containing protein [Bacillus aquiflavi]NEY80628.1 helix-turn-helix domain-containing protein [Bacillus aquiflavi]UAC49440.1 DUF4115 domain-containing protein [Bacillus aquiflavi]